MTEAIAFPFGGEPKPPQVNLLADADLAPVIPISDAITIPGQASAPAAELTSGLQIADFYKSLPKPKLDLGVSVEAKTARERIHNARMIAQVAIAGVLISPANEVMRIAAASTTSAMAHGNPMVGGVTTAALTFGIESVAALASAEPLTTNSNKRLLGWVNHKLQKNGVPENAKLAGWKKNVATLFGGSVVGMELEVREDMNRSAAANLRTGLFDSLWLAAAVLPAGYAGNEVIDAVFSHPIGSAEWTAGAVALVAGGVKAKRVAGRRETPTELRSWRADSDKHGLSYGVIDPNDTEALEKAAIIEQDVWDEKAYGDLDEEGYTDDIKHSHTLAAFDNEGNCVGVNRMFGAGADTYPPFLRMTDEDGNLLKYDPKQREAIVESVRAGETEELGTVAVQAELRGKGVNLRLWRTAWRDARDRGVKYWGIVMEPERVAKMNKYHGFTFRQFAEPVWYQGGYCAPFIMDMKEAPRHMQWRHPLTHTWFVRLAQKS